MTRIPDSIRTPQQILGGSLQTLYDHARSLLELQAKVRSIVPGDIYVAACESGTLHLVTPSAGLATRVRYNQRKLIARLHQPGKYLIERVKVSVRPDSVLQRPDVRNALPPSLESGRHIEATAKYIEDEGLRKALIRLAGRARDQ